MKFEIFTFFSLPSLLNTLVLLNFPRAGMLLWGMRQLPAWSRQEPPSSGAAPQQRAGQFGHVQNQTRPPAKDTSQLSAWPTLTQTRFSQSHCNDPPTPFLMLEEHREKSLMTEP